MIGSFSNSTSQVAGREDPSKQTMIGELKRCICVNTCTSFLCVCLCLHVHTRENTNTKDTVNTLLGDLVCQGCSHHSFPERRKLPAVYRCCSQRPKTCNCKFISADPAADEQMARRPNYQRNPRTCAKKTTAPCKKCTVPRASLGWVAVGKKAEGDTDYTFIMHTCT